LFTWTLIRPCFTSAPISEALSDNAAKAQGSALEIGRLAGVEFEVLFRCGAVQMGY
jgi:hypothetical protein